MSIDQSHHQPYQVILLGPDSANRQKTFSEELNKGIRNLGLDPAADCQILCFDDLGGDDEIRWCNAPVFVWCGAQDNHADVNAQVDLAVKALKRGNPVFAVVDNLDQPPFSKQVPQLLASFNGMVWERLPELATHVLQAFGMFRRGKRTFISYRRKESREIAVQLFDVLHHRGYDVFLDTASIAPGRAVQEDLKARLADVDVVILLHTADAFDSAWVYEEVLDAQLRGTEVLDVRWPDIKPMADLKLSEPFQLLSPDILTEVSLTNDSALRMTLQTQLSRDCMRRLLPEIEAARIRSVRTRRDRIVRQLSEDAAQIGMEAVFCPTGSKALAGIPHVMIREAGNQSIKGLSFVSDGIPVSRDIHSRTRKVADSPPLAPEKTRIVYDEFGVLVDDLDHLDWLNLTMNSSGPVNTSRLCDARKWMKTL